MTCTGNRINLIFSCKRTLFWWPLRMDETGLSPTDVACIWAFRHVSSRIVSPPVSGEELYVSDHMGTRFIHPCLQRGLGEILVADRGFRPLETVTVLVWHNV